MSDTTETQAADSNSNQSHTMEHGDSAGQFTDGKAWINELPEDYRDEYWGKFSQNEDTRMVQMPETFLKSYRDLEGRLGKNTLPIPETDEQRLEVSKALGWEPDLEKYQGSFEAIEMPEGVTYDDQEEQMLIQLAHANNIPVKQAANIREQIVKSRLDAIKDATDTRQAYLKDVQDEFQREFRGDLGVMRNRARAAMEDYGDPGLVEIFENAEYEGKKLGDHPLFFKFMARLGQDKVGQNDERGRDADGMNRSKDTIEAEIANLQTNAAYMDRSHPEHKAINMRMQRLFQELHGEF